MAPSLPEQIGRYPVERELGSGSMGSVYLGRDPELDRAVAIKTVRAQLGSEQEREAFLVRFRNEARAVGRLQHPSVVAVFDVGTDEVVGPYLVFEYVEGSTLKEVLRARGPLQPAALLSLADQVAGAIDAAHREGIIHRDIKPDNLLMGRDGRTRLADFGVARVPDAVLTGEGQFLGTPCYGAPETLRGGDYSPASDLFSLAAVVYEAVAGVRAFSGADAVAAAHMVIHEDPPPVSEAALPEATVPPALDGVLRRALSKEPANRFPSAAALVHALRAAYASSGGAQLDGRVAAGLEGTGLADTVPAHKSLRVSAPAARPSRVPLLVGGAAALVFGVGVVVYFAPSAPDIDDAAQAALGAGRGETGQGGDSPAAAALDAAVAGPVDAGLAQPEDAAVEPALSAFEREERAKDALDRARAALAVGDGPTALQALDEATKYDPEHPDIPVLRRRL